MRKKKILIAVAVGLVALEVALQLGVFVLSLVYSAPTLGSERSRGTWGSITNEGR